MKRYIQTIVVVAGIFTAVIGGVAAVGVPGVRGPEAEPPTPFNPDDRMTKEEFERQVKAEKERKINKSRDLMKIVNRPIDFYGAVVDQDKKPVVGAKIKASIRVLKEPAPGLIGEMFEYPEAVTDAEGKFSFKGFKGSLLSIKKVEKQGYLPTIRDVYKGSYWYNEAPERAYKPNHEKPEVFRMWKQAGAERLVNGEIRKGLGNTPEFKTFNLFTGKEDPEGDLKIRVYSTPRIPPKWDSKVGKHPQDFIRENLSWNADIEVVDGGIVEMEHDEIYLAPEKGYQPKWVFHMPAVKKKEDIWNDLKEVDLFIHCRGKYYGRMKVNLSVGTDHERPDRSSVGITYFLNPSGSRNLEYDINNRIDPRLPTDRNVKALKVLEKQKQKRREELKEKAKKEGKKFP